MLTPYSEMITNIKDEGLYFDIGCGHGLLAQLLASKAHRKVIACDHDEERIQTALASTKDFSNVLFYKGGFKDTLESLNIQNKFDGIFLIDVLHYLDSKEQEVLLHQIRDHLQDDGIFIMREVHPQGGIISQFNRFYEWVMTKTGFTKSQNLTNTFKTPEEWKNLLVKCGFSSVQSRKCTFWLFADYLFEARVTAQLK